MGETTALARDDATERTLELIRRAERGDKAALAEVRKLFDEHPALWERTGDLALRAREAWVEMVLGDQALGKEALKRKLDAMRRELAGPDATPLERLLADRVATCWLQVSHADAIYAQAAKSMGGESREYYQRRQERAHRQYLSAIRTLAQVRRLIVPMVQVNIAREQNIAQIVGPTGGKIDREATDPMPEPSASLEPTDDGEVVGTP